MNIWKLSLKNVFAKPLNALLTLIMLSMGIALASLIILVGDALNSSFRQNIKGVDMVVGAKGSPLGIILSAIYQIDSPNGNISKAEADKLAKNPLVSSAIQLSFGDSYRGYRIIGTSQAYPKLYDAQIQQGRFWQSAFEITLGSKLAKELNMKLGDTFYSAHGTDENAEEHHEHPFVVVGILGDTQTVVDRLLLTSPESIWKLHESHSDTARGYSENREITAMLVKFRNKMGIIMLPRMVNKETNMQAAIPAIEVNRLLSLFGVGISTLATIAWCILVLGGVSIFVSMINSLKERAYEMALIRTMGASRIQLFLMILMEASILALLGITCGLVISHTAVLVLNKLASDQFGIQLAIFEIHPDEVIIITVAFATCIVSAILPALRAINLDVSKILSEYEN